jgi:hypothetical protein
MLLYHGTEIKENKESIINNGFKYCTDGNYGIGVYATTDIDLALQYSEHDEDMLIKLSIPNEYVKKMKYSKVANLFGYEKKMKSLNVVKKFLNYMIMQKKTILKQF